MLGLIIDALAKVAPMLVLAALLLPSRMISRGWIFPVVTALFLIDAVLLNVTTWADGLDLVPGRWNWEGKIAAIAFVALALFAMPGDMMRQVGLFAAPPRASWPALVAVATFACGFAFARTIYFGEPEPMDVGAIAYQATMPGLHEELTFRGVWWVLVATALDPDRLSRQQIPWRTLAVTTIWFACVHAVSVAADGALSINWLYFAATSISGLLYGLLQAVGRVVWAPILAHGLVNVIIYGWQMTLA